jgi:hypothetical protein
MITRILSGLIITLTLTTLLGHLLFPEPAADDYPWIENLLPLLMGISVLGLFLAWRWEMLGGALSLFFFLLQLALYRVIRGHFFPLQGLLVFSPLPITALLFMYLGQFNRMSPPSITLS